MYIGGIWAQGDLCMHYGFKGYVLFLFFFHSFMFVADLCIVIMSRNISLHPYIYTFSSFVLVVEISLVRVMDLLFQSCIGG